MILRRLGNKRANVPKYTPLMPPHEVYFEPFFGAGGMFFHKRPIAKHNYLNYLDGDIHNLFMVILNQPDELNRLLQITPYHVLTFKFMKTWQPVRDVERALRFIVLSNWSLLDKSDTLRLRLGNDKANTIAKLRKTIDFLLKPEMVIQFHCTDFRKFLHDYSTEQSKTYIFNDPPYIGTVNNYNTPKWTESDLADLVQANLATGCKFGVCEYTSPTVLAIAKEYGLHTIVISNEMALNKKARQEIYLTNYTHQQRLF